VSTGRLFSKVVRVTCWRESAPIDPTNFTPKILGNTLGQTLASSAVVPIYSAIAKGQGETVGKNTAPKNVPNAVEVTDLRVQFKVTRGLTKTPPQADVIITNLSETTRTSLETKPLLVQLDAGYDGTPRLLFIGDMRFAMTELKPPDWETLLQLGDGDCHHRWSRVNRSYAPGTTYLTALQNAAKSFGMKLPDNVVKDPALQQQFATGHVSQGATRDEFTRLLAPFGYHWSIQHGQLLVQRDDEVVPGEFYAIDEENGMIGTPQFGSPPRSGKPPHVHVDTLLYPELMPGKLVQLTSKALKGKFKIVRTEHHGDSHGDRWTTRCELKPI
jgi:hypothetical protein